MKDYQEKIWDALAGMTGEEVLQYLTDYHGTQLLDKGFQEHLVEEGVLEEDSEEEGDDEEDEDE
jgi:hypothetical protein